MTTQQAFDLALQHHQAGRLAEAEAVYAIFPALPQNLRDWRFASGAVGVKVR